MGRASGALALAAGCGWADGSGTRGERACVGVTAYLDADADGFGDPAVGVTGCLGDGWVPQAGDCDDARADVFLGAPEICDGRDNDCDPKTPEDHVAGSTTWVDADGDGYGDPLAPQTACVGPGAVIVVGDCDDTDPRVHPDAEERCARGDEDCDPWTTDDDAAEAVLWYADADGDGHGNPIDAVRACERPPDRTLVGDDCDDLDETVFPKSPERCDGGLDNDCDPETDEHTVVRWFRDGDGDGFGVDADPGTQGVPVEPVTGCAPPEGYVGRSGDCDDEDPLLNPTLTPGCVQVHCGRVIASQTWKPTVEHHVTCDVVVDSEILPRLTVLDGAVVRFDRKTGLRVGEGRGGQLLVDATDRGVSFVSASETPLPGDWDGVYLGKGDRGSVLRGLTVRHAGRGGRGAIVVSGGSPTLENVLCEHNRGQGLYVVGGAPLVVRSRFVENTGGGVWVAATAGLAERPLVPVVLPGGEVLDGPSFEQNVATRNGGRPLGLPAAYIDELAQDNTVDGNAVDEIRVLGGTVSQAGTWRDLGVPYVVIDHGPIRVDGGPDVALTLEPGVELAFGVGAGLVVGDRLGGKLLVAATEDHPVTFTGAPHVLRVDDVWQGLVFGPADLGSELAHVVVRNAGGGRARANVHVDGSQPHLWALTSEYGRGSGVVVTGKSGAPEIRDGTFVHNEEHGVYVAPEAGLAVSPLGPTFVNNLVTSNAGSPVVVPAEALRELASSSQYVGNGGPIRVLGGPVRHDATWRALDETYEVEGSIEIGGEEGPVVTVEDGVELRFARDTALGVGVEGDGALVVDRGDERVLFDALEGPEDDRIWGGLRIGRGRAEKLPTSLVGLTIAHAGGGRAVASVELVDRDGCEDEPPPVVRLEDVELTAGAKVGVYARGRTAFAAEELTIEDTPTCFDVRPSPTPGCTPEVVTFRSNVCAPGAVFGQWPLEQVAALDGSSVYPSEVTIESGDVTTDVMVPALPVPFGILDGIRVAGPDAPLLTVSPGAVLAFHAGALEVGVGEPGAVLAVGATFTSAAATPSPGDWGGIHVGPACLATTLRRTTIAWGGANGKGNLWIDGCTRTTIDRVLSSYSASCGLYEGLPHGKVAAGVSVVGAVGAEVCP